ncbi:MAG TPA: Crp/Fnr family transcriptional regulator [Blastocatellia bacterium]|nr:Crp/Fnr family transcriptional regulator [Blastocatellia bacterium]
MTPATIVRDESFAGTRGRQATRLPSVFSGLTVLPHVERAYWRGMAVYSLEDPAAHIYVLLSGRVKIVRASMAGQNKITSIRHRGDVFGELALAGNAIEARRSDEAVALETTRVAMIRVEDFWRLKAGDPAVVQGALQCLTARLAEAHRQIETLVFDNNHRRLARALLEQYGNAARVGETSVRLTHEELAELIGSSREVVTSLMIELRRLGLVDYKRGNVYPRLPELERFLAEGNLPE